MKVEIFEMERMQSTYENVVKYNMSESGVHPVSMFDMRDMGLDIDAIIKTPFFYSQSNGTIELREKLAGLYPGTTIDHFEVTNGSSEANFVVTMTLVEKGDYVLFEFPNYMQLHGVSKAFGAEIIPVTLSQKHNWEPDWDEFEAAMFKKPKMMYISNPNNPTGSVLSPESMKRIVSGIEKSGTFLLSDEVYQGAEFDGNISPSFWGMSENVIVVSGLSKAYGIPGARIGWIVGQPDFIEQCWEKHDYITIAPGTLSDLIAQTAVEPENRLKLYARTRQIIGENRKIFREWVAGFDGFLEYTEQKAGAIAFVKVNSDIPSIDLIKQLHKNKDVLIVPGAHLGMEGYFRIALGEQKERFVEALGLIKEEFDTIR